MKGFCEKIFIVALMLLYSMTLWSQNAPSKDNVILDQMIMEDGYAKVSNVTNLSDREIKIFFVKKDGSTSPLSLSAGQSMPIMPELICSRSYISRNKDNGGNIDLWERQPVVNSQMEDAQSNNQDGEELEVPSANTRNNRAEHSSSERKSITEKKHNNKDNQPKKNEKNDVKVEDVISDFDDYIEGLSSYSQSTIDEEKNVIDTHITSVRNWKDKGEYVREKKLNTYISEKRDEINQLKENINKLTDEFLSTTYNGKKLVDRDECEDAIKAVLRERIQIREKNLDRLENEINESPISNRIDFTDINWYIDNWKFVAAGVGFILLLFIIIGWLARKSRRKAQRETLINATSQEAEAASAIVVRRKTMSILKTQNVDDVTGNPDYLRIDCNEFCDDSAVRLLYIKNSCIKDIYNMYAEDLRNPNNPKEDGCMVLGRWVYDKDNDEYYVTLEHIVQPGDDAIFSEYELNFGGKIKLKVAEKLRKLRRDTNLQYDLTCWVHSHPGLGVFFSNSDSNVQGQLKHPTHPKFLTAMVVDILTPKQDLGIFTFKRDASINSKADLKKLYSLEDMFKWAVESERNSFKSDDYFNISATAKEQGGGEILLSNGAIIDMEMMIANQRTGLIGWVHGFEKRQGLKCKLVAMTTKETDKMVDNELLGCFMVGSHCSIPTIKKAVANYMTKIKFVLVYTTNDGLLTAIPVNNGELCTEDKFYGEQKYEDLKIWTRRKR